MTQTASTRRQPSPAGPGPAHLVLGRFGETYAARHLVSSGMVLLERNWRGSRWEVDLILRDGGTLVLCEVKTRTGASHGHAIEAVDATKLARLQTAAEEWLQARGIKPVEVRFDAIAIVVDHGVVTELEHVRGIG